VVEPAVALQAVLRGAGEPDGGGLQLAVEAVGQAEVGELQSRGGVDCDPHSGASVGGEVVVGCSGCGVRSLEESDTRLPQYNR